MVSVIYSNPLFNAVLRIQTRGICKIWKIFADLRIHGSKYQPKAAKKIFTRKTENWTIDKRGIIKISWFLNGLSSFSIKKSEKIRQICKFVNFTLLKNSVNFKEITWIRSRILFSSADPGSGSESKWILSTDIIYARLTVPFEHLSE